MDDTGTLSALPDSGTALMIGAVAILSRGTERSAVCRRCGRELGRGSGASVGGRRAEQSTDLSLDHLGRPDTRATRHLRALVAGLRRQVG